MRYFYFWCERCPTRITIETEVPAASPGDELEYTFADFVGLAQVRAPTPTDDGTEGATLCPACGGVLHDMDELVARDEVPVPFSCSAEAHATWRAKRREE